MADRLHLTCNTRQARVQGLALGAIATTACSSLTQCRNRQNLCNKSDGSQIGCVKKRMIGSSKVTSKLKRALTPGGISRAIAENLLPPYLICLRFETAKDSSSSERSTAVAQTAPTYAIFSTQFTTESRGAYRSLEIRRGMLGSI
jgi:hypothetical protein